MSRPECDDGTCGCGICRTGPRREAVERLLSMGFSSYKVEQRSRNKSWKDRGFPPVKSETVRKHVMSCLAADVEMVTADEGVVIPALARESLGKASKQDLAEIVRRKAVEGVEKGDLKVTLRDGLEAQKMIDRREEKQRGRELAFVVAAMAAGAVPPPEILPDTIIEGIAVEVE